ncbi:MAG TPA: Hsp20/alpha crystallin family protein [Chloroflexota bacterium]|nr:Hsp20/alpha crystallin family protein [Chloroflexota bacterium]
MATNVTRYAPRDVVSTRSLIDQLVEGSFFAPAMFDRLHHNPAFPANLLETDDAYTVQIALPGLNSEKLEIQSLGRELRVKGEYETTPVEKATYIWTGLPTGEFSHGFTLPAEVANDRAEARYVNGILNITLPKSEHAKVKTIPVSTSA